MIIKMPSTFTRLFPTGERPIPSVWFHWMLILLLTPILFSCAGTPSGPSTAQPAPTAYAPETDTLEARRRFFAPLPEDLHPLHILPGDVLRVTLRGNGTAGEEWGGEFPVPEDGRIDFLYAGTINVVGMTRGELKQLLRRRLSPDYYVRPGISVNLVSPGEITVRIMGAVGTPQRVQLERGARLMDAVVEGGSLTQNSERVRIYTFRNDHGDTKVFYSNWEKYVQGDFRQDISLRDNDIIYVRTRFWPHFDTLKELLQTIGFGVGTADTLQDLGDD